VKTSNVIVRAGNQKVGYRKQIKQYEHMFPRSCSTRGTVYSDTSALRPDRSLLA